MRWRDVCLKSLLFSVGSAFSLLKLLLYFSSSVLSRLTFAVSFVERNRIASSIYRTGHLIIFFFCASNCLQSNQYQVKKRGKTGVANLPPTFDDLLRVVGTSVVFFTTTYALGRLPGSIFFFFVFVRQGMKVYTSGWLLKQAIEAEKLITQMASTPVLMGFVMLIKSHREAFRHFHCVYNTRRLRVGGKLIVVSG